ncbi:MAG TPA: flagellar hook-associated protein FlgK [Steroidobacteraceae bacterium]
MSDIFQISVSALQAFQQAINVTSNNVANANTPGYDKESINLQEALPQSNGVATVGSGVAVEGISRAYSQTAANQNNASQASLGQLNALQSYSSQIDNLFGTTIGGLSTAVQGYYSAWQTVANDPTSTAARQALLNQAQSVASSFQNASGQLNALNGDINQQISTDVQQVNSISSAIATLNNQITQSTAQNGGQAPNELLDQRDQQVANLSKIVGVSTTTDSNGALNVFVGGQPLVLQGQTYQLKTVGNQYNASQLEIGTSASTATISSAITSGDLGGLLAARNQVVNPALSQLGQVATTLAQTANTQQAQGLDLHGALGTALFSTGSPLATASSLNSDNVTASATINSNGLGSLTADSYVITAKAGGTLSVSNASDGSSVSFTGAGTAANPLVVNGVSIVLSGTPAAGDQFLIQPTAQAASTIKSVLSDPTKVAAAGAVIATAGTSNTGSGQITSGTVLDGTNPNLLTPATITFTGANTYSINGGANQAYTAGSNIAANGWQVQISGTPAVGDTFSVASNTAGTGDNRNAIIAGDQQTTGVLNSGTISVTGALSGLITGLGSQAQQINTAQAAQTQVANQAQTSLQSTSGVNLDEEAASLLQWQQSYQAAAQALAIGNSLFTTLINSVNGTFT